MINERDVHNHCEKSGNYPVSCMKYFSWTAVLIGALVGIGITFLLNLFSIAISLSAFTVDNVGTATLAVGGLMGIAIGVIISMYTAGWVAGYLGRAYCFKRNLGALYGFTAWCLALLIMVVAVSQLGRYVSAYTNFISHPTLISSAKPLIQIDAISVPSSSEVVIDTQKAAQNLAITSFIVFLLFFLGALASCFGGHCGMGYRCKNEKCDIEPHV